MFNLEKFLLQLSYNCSPKDAQNLELLQKQIQERINFLNENNMDSYNDQILLDMYEKHGEIQQCLFQDHADQYLLIIGIIVAVSFFVYFRWKMIKRGESSKKRFNFKG